MYQSAGRRRSTFIAITAVMGALVIVLDYSMKFSGLKIPFPFLPILKFDFSGIPIVIAFLLCGLPSGTVTCIAAFLGILVRSGAAHSAFMRATAEFSTIMGMAPFYTRGLGRKGRILGTIAGMALRVLTMTLLNLWVLPTFHKIPVETVIAILFPIAVFNMMLAGINIGGGWMLYQALIRRIPSLTNLNEK